MKYILIALLAIPSISFAQTKPDYEHAIGKFMKFYNSGQTDSIISQYSDMWGSNKPGLWTPEQNKKLQEKYGKMISYKYLGMSKEDNVAVFRTVFSKSTHATSLSLDKQKKIETFRFDTMSDEIKVMMKKE